MLWWMTGGCLEWGLGDGMPGLILGSVNVWMVGKLKRLLGCTLCVCEVDRVEFKKKKTNL